MTTATSSPPAAPEDQQIAVQAMQAWQQGQQDQALALLRPQADAGYQWAVVLMVWFLHQRGEPGWREAVPFAEQAIQMGIPWVANYVVGNMMNAAALRPQASKIMQDAALLGFPSDPMGWAQNALQQGDAATGVSLLNLKWPGPWASPEQWRQLVDEATESTATIRRLADEASQERQRLAEAASSAAQAIDANQASIQTKTTQLETLLEQITNAEVKSFFDEEASQNKKESTLLWYLGLAVVVLAAGLTVTPLLIHYLGHGAKLSPTALLTAHLAPTAALAGVAGVLLSRSRGRDRTRQKARDLSIALGTVFVYAGQMANETEKQKFQHDMARAIIESFLKAETHGTEETAGLLSLLTSEVSPSRPRTARHRPALPIPRRDVNGHQPDSNFNTAKSSCSRSG